MVTEYNFGRGGCARRIVFFSSLHSCRVAIGNGLMSKQSRQSHPAESRRSGGQPSRGGRPQKPTDDPEFFHWEPGMKLTGSLKASVSYTVEAHVADGTFGRVLRCREERIGIQGRLSRPGRQAATVGAVVGGVLWRAAKVMRKQDKYLQYTSDAEKEGSLLTRLEEAQDGELLTMSCVDSFPTEDSKGVPYWCLVFEWMDASIFDVVKANGGSGLPLVTIQEILRQLLSQLQLLHRMQCTHTDIKHKNCCLVSSAHYLVLARDSRPTLLLIDPRVKLIDYGNATFEDEPKTYPIHTKQFRAPEVLLDSSEGWGPPSDIWTLGVTVGYMVRGQLLFNSHEPRELIDMMVKHLGALPTKFLNNARNKGMCRAADEAATAAPSTPVSGLASRLGISTQDANRSGSPEALLVDIIRRMLAPDPSDRITACEALEHDFLKAEIPMPFVPVGADVHQIQGRVSTGLKPV